MALEGGRRRQQRHPFQYLTVRRPDLWSERLPHEVNGRRAPDNGQQIDIRLIGLICPIAQTAIQVHGRQLICQRRLQGFNCRFNRCLG